VAYGPATEVVRSRTRMSESRSNPLPVTTRGRRSNGGYRKLDAVRTMPFTLEIDCRGIGLIDHTLAVTGGHERGHRRKQITND
jgi:hypothetical protein